MLRDYGTTCDTYPLLGRQVCLVGAHIAKSELLQNSLTFIKTLTKITVYLIINTSIGNMIL